MQTAVMPERPSVFDCLAKNANVVRLNIKTRPDTKANARAVCQEVVEQIGFKRAYVIFRFVKRISRTADEAIAACWVAGLSGYPAKAVISHLRPDMREELFDRLESGDI